MELTRRTILTTGTRAMLAAGTGALLAPSLVRAAGTGWFRDAMVIDGLSALSDPYAPEDQTRLSDRVKAELRKSGITAMRITVGPVGNQPDMWEQVNSFIDQMDAAFAANPDFLLKIEKAADIEAAQKSGRVGLIYGTQIHPWSAPTSTGWRS